MNVFDANTLIREMAVLVAIVSMLLLAAMIYTLLRTRNLPGCWNCGFQDVRRSHSHPLLDTFARGILLYPHRCGKCLDRFYCFRSRSVPRRSSGRTMAAGRG